MGAFFEDSVFISRLQVEQFSVRLIMLSEGRPAVLQTEKPASRKGSQSTAALVLADLQDGMLLQVLRLHLLP